MEKRYEESEGISRGYLDGEGDFPDRPPWLILCGGFLQEQIEAVERWAVWATATVEAWPDDLKSAEPDLATLEAMTRRWETREPRVVT